jgi:hypothetical protein
MQRRVQLEPPVRDPTRYDLVVIGTPIWVDAVASPVRSYLEAHRNELVRVAFFCTCGRAGDRRTFGQMAELCGLAPIATLSVRDTMIEDCGLGVAQFAEEIARRVPGVPAPFVVGPPI